MTRPGLTILAQHMARNAPAPGPETRIEQRSVTADIIFLHLTNVALTVVTFGIYRFWAKTEMRRYLWSTTELWGDPFEYTGTPGELFKSFLKAIVVVAFLYGSFFGVALGTKGLPPLVTLGGFVALYILLIYIATYAAYSARRYRVGRTLWRGIRCDQSGSPAEYATKMLRATGLLCITAGLSMPYMDVEAHRYAIENTSLGSERFTFDGKAGDLMGAWVKAWLLALPTLGISVFWYAFHEHRYLFAHTRFGNVRFRSDVYALDAFFLFLGNFVLMIVTLGLAAPYVLVRTMRFGFERVAILGRPDFAALTQSTAPERRGGEGLLDLLDGDIA